MNKRAVWIGIILLVISILSLNNVLAGDVEDCNSNGGIWCGIDAAAECKNDANDGIVDNKINFPEYVCDINVNQNIILFPDWSNQGGYSLDYPKNIILKSLNVQQGIKLQFYLTNYTGAGVYNGDMAVHATCAEAIRKDNAFPYGGIARTPDEFTVSKGGNGGNAGMHDPDFASPYRG
ncbi:MAG: hypothetical protein ACP5N1_02920, partial [Candidatus Woesearchaeota archaeon]